MAGELVGYGTSGATYDFFAYNAANEVWDGAAFVEWDDGDYVSYRIPATEIGTNGRFVGDSPDPLMTAYEMRTQAVTLAGSNVVWESSKVTVSPTGLDGVIPADPTTIPVLGVSSIVVWIGYFGAWTLNEVNVTETQAMLLNSAGTDVLATHDLSDDGSTFISEEAV